ncbi:hypothetical protein MauCBS54593_006100 [Microsporum audouinii]
MDCGLSSTREDTLERQLINLEAIRELLTVEQELEILRNFFHRCTQNRQVLWSGVPYHCVQRWAKNHGMQTLSMAMGPLMDKKDPSCPKSSMKPNKWSKYIKGASAIFAFYISRGGSVIVLTPPPPFKFNPSGATNYQAIEEPIVKGVYGGRAVSRIEFVHPTVRGAEDFLYQAWPNDQTSIWVANFGSLPVEQPPWRTARMVISLRIITKENETTAGQPIIQDTGAANPGIGGKKVVRGSYLVA